jgi:NADPH:quinone reductase-like Zn-dependent oxidoreductase
MMKQWTLARFGMDHLKRGVAAVPKPGPRELLIKVSAASLNYRDKLVVEGSLLPGLPLPFVPASDAVGRVEAVGEGAVRFRPGDRVITHFFLKWMDGPVRSEEDSVALGGPLPGVLSEYIVIHEDGVLAAPAYLSDVEASTLPIAALTAWSALFENQPRKPGETVLVQGTGGVSLFAVQLAAAFGSRVIVISSSDEKLSRTKKLGATETVNYFKREDWDQEILALTHGRGVDRVLEVAGGDATPRSLNALARGGKIALIGFLQGQTMKLPILPFMMKFASIYSVGVGHRKAFEAMNRALAAKEIHPVLDTVYPFDAVREAFAHLNRGPFGKVVIDFQK